MAKVKIEGVPPLDGDYDLDVSKFNGHELHVIKQVSGVRANELREAGAAGDYDLMIALAMIAARRAGVAATAEQLLEADVGKITIDYTEQEAEERPPASQPPSGNANSAGDSENGSGGTTTSGLTSNTIGDQPPNRLSRTGLPGSAAPADSAPKTLAT